jgi:hypothetical protein
LQSLVAIDSQLLSHLRDVKQGLLGPDFVLLWRLLWVDPDNTHRADAIDRRPECWQTDVGIDLAQHLGGHVAGKLENNLFRVFLCKLRQSGVAQITAEVTVLLVCF